MILFKDRKVKRDFFKGGDFHQNYTETLWADIDPKYKKLNGVASLFSNWDKLKKKGIEAYEYNHNDPKNTPSKK